MMRAFLLCSLWLALGSASPVVAAEQSLSAVLVKRGDSALVRRDVSAARLLYQRAAELGDERAAAAVGRTYDPAFLAQIGASGLTGDPTAAAMWRERAIGLRKDATSAEPSPPPPSVKGVADEQRPPPRVRLAQAAPSPPAAPGNPQATRLQAGDVLQVVFPGEEAFSTPIQVDRQGRVTLPEVGTVSVAGLTLSEALAAVRRTLSSRYRDVDRSDLVLRERRIPLTVLGAVRQPGDVEIRADGNVQVAVNAAGGLVRGAQLDRMQLRRDGRVTVFDYQRYLNSGDSRSLPTLRPLDEIFVPASPRAAGGEGEAGDQRSWLTTPSSQAVRVIGAVRNPGRYDWSDEMSLVDLIAQAGGPTAGGPTGGPEADLSRVRIVPGDRGGRAVVYDLRRFLEQGGRASSLPEIRGGYTVVVPTVPPRLGDIRSQWVEQRADRSIYVLGSVGRPGRYAFEERLSFLDILSAADGPTSTADLLSVRVAHRGEGRDRVSRVDLARYLESGDESLLPRVRPGDVIFVPDRNRNWLEQPSGSVVRVLGAVNRPGRYPFRDGMNMLDLLAEAGGPSRDALDERIVVVNLSCCENEARTFNLPAFARRGDITQLPLVRAGDTIYVPNYTRTGWRLFSESFRDVLSVLTLVALLAR